ncbi:YtjB family periplasmic protein [[Erwinia] mediterraneensis]|uniref:YtjB family periplasmic protein n=1 Tax=[Erwinia] mediterraneensis TaxID=2161819 RepID=UPI0010326F72|nr:YtjB family periplasmic protein [[Erwinia] mediterraneensis]
MVKSKLKFRLHRTVIVLISLTLLVILMQGASWFSLGHQMARSEQVEELAHTLTKQVAFSLQPLLDSGDDNRSQIQAILDQMTSNSRILDASVYADDGSLLAHSGEGIDIRDRLALDGKRAGSYFNHQIVQPLTSQEGPLGFLRVTLDTHVLITESRQVDNTTNVLRLMMLLSLAIGIILTRTLLRDRRTRWQQSPFLLTASKPVQEESEAGTEETPR